MRTLLSMMFAGAAIWTFGGEDLLSSNSPSAMLVFAGDTPAMPNQPIVRATEGDARLTVERDRDGLFYVDAKVNEQPIRFLFDTGASRTVLTAADAKRVGLNHSRRRGGTLTTASGTITTKKAHIAQLEVASHMIEDSEALIVDNALPVSLLGQDVLARMGSVTVTGDTLLFY